MRHDFSQRTKFHPKITPNSPKFTQIHPSKIAVGGDLTHRDRDALERFLSAHRLPLVPELTVHNYYDLCFEQPPAMARRVCVVVLSAEPAPLIDALVSSRRFVERGLCACVCACVCVLE